MVRPMPGTHFTRFCDAINSGAPDLSADAVQALLNQLNNEERCLAEDAVIERYRRGESLLAPVVKRMKHHDGSRILEEVLKDPDVTNEMAVRTAIALANGNLAEIVKETFRRVYVEDRYYRSLIATELWRFSPSEDLFDFIAELLGIETREFDRVSLAIAMLTCCGYISDPNDSDQVMKMSAEISELTISSSRGRGDALERLSQRMFQR